jgi:GDPmannose 4,6-dehydratase
MWMILQAEKPRDFVIATGETHTVREFVETAFSHVGLNWQDHVKIDPVLFRPAEVDILLGNPILAQNELGWKAQITFKGLVETMIDADMEL